MGCKPEQSNTVGRNYERGKRLMRIIATLKSAFLCATLCALCLANNAVAAISITNGNFDKYTGGFVPGGQNGSYWIHVPNSGTVGGLNSPLEGWGVGFAGLASSVNPPSGNPNGVDLVTSITGNLTPADSGKQFVDLNGTSGPGNIYQTLENANATSPGQSYLVTFKFASTVASQASARAFDGTTTATQLGLTTSIPFLGDTLPSLSSGLQWYTGSLLFTAASNVTTIVFDQIKPFGGNTGVYLDSVSIRAVPEASSLVVAGLTCLMGIGAVVVGRRYGFKLSV